MDEDYAGDDEPTTEPNTSTDEVCDWSDDNLQCAAENNFITTSNSIPVLLAMAFGIKDRNGEQIVDYASQYPWLMKSKMKKKKREWFPTQSILVKEIKRRKVMLDDDSKTNMQMNKVDSI